jgi:hypothetical protein
MDNELEYLEALEFFLESNDWFAGDDSETDNKSEKDQGLMYWADKFNAIY